MEFVREIDLAKIAKFRQEMVGESMIVANKSDRDLCSFIICEFTGWALSSDHSNL